MKRFKRFLSALLTLLISITNLSILSVSAQETNVALAVQVFLNNSDQKQTQLKYDIFEVDQEGYATVVYQHTAETPEDEMPLLTAGKKYLFRLYDSGDFIRDELALEPAKVSVTNPHEDVDKKYLILEDAGIMNPKADDIMAHYDLKFELPFSNNYLTESGNYVCELRVELANETLFDQVSQASEDELDNRSTSQQTEQPQKVVEETTQVAINLVLPEDYPSTQLEIVLSSELWDGDYRISQLVQGENVVEGIEFGQANVTIENLAEGYKLVTEAIELGETPATIEVVKEEAPTSRLAFTLIDTQENRIQGATVSLVDTEYSAVTNENGTVVFEALPIGSTYTYNIIYPEGYSGQTEGEILIQEGEDGTNYVSIRDIEFARNVLFEFQTSQDYPVETGDIKLVGNDTYTFTLDKNTETTVNNIEEGTYQVEVTNLADGYELINDTIEVSYGKVNLIELREKAVEVNRLVFTLLDNNKEPVQEAVVKLVEPGLTATTNENGVAIFDDLPIGTTYTYNISYPQDYKGPEEGTHVISENGDGTNWLTIDTITKDEPEPEIVKGTLKVKVVDDSNNLLANQKVQVAESEYLTDENGQVQVELDTNTYTVILPASDEYIANEASKQVVAGEVSELTIQRTAKKDGQIKVIVKDQADKVIEGVTVSLAGVEKSTDENGVVNYTSLAKGSYKLEAVNLPSSYKAVETKDIKLDTANAIQEVVLRVEREVKLSTAEITVVDNQGSKVPNAKVKFGGLQKVTNNDGKVSFTDLEPGNYYYSVLEVEGPYKLTGIEEKAVVSEGMHFTAELKVEKEVDKGKVTFKAVDNKNNALANVKVVLNGVEVITNQDGVAVVNGLKAGDYNYYVTEIPSNYVAKETSGKVTLKANEAKEVQLTFKKTEQEESNQQAVTTTKIEGAKTFKDESTGVTVKVDQQDAEKIQRVVVERRKEDPTAKAKKNTVYASNKLFPNLKTDIVNIKLVGRDNNEVSLTKLAEVSIPLRNAETAQNLYRVKEGNEFATIMHSVNDSNLVFQTKQMGTFAITYATDSSKAEVKVDKSKEVEKDDKDLPKTGEASNTAIIIVAVVAVLAGIFFLTRRNKN